MDEHIFMTARIITDKYMDSPLAQAKALDVAGLLVTPKRERQVIEKFLREQHTPSVRIENPELIRSFMAKAYREGFTAGQSRAMRHMSDEPDLPLAAPNPYEHEGETDVPT